MPLTYKAHQILFQIRCSLGLKKDNLDLWSKSVTLLENKRSVGSHHMHAFLLCQRNGRSKPKSHIALFIGASAPKA